MAKLPTTMIDVDGQCVMINASDFDDSKHKLFVKKESKKVIVEEPKKEVVIEEPKKEEIETPRPMRKRKAQE